MNSKGGEQMEGIRLLLPKELLKSIDDFRFKYRFASRLKAIRFLIEWALTYYPEQGKGIPEQDKLELRFDTSGKLRVIDEIDGYYVVGQGMAKQVRGKDEGLILIEKLKRKEE
jgi:hypothetical protein